MENDPRRTVVTDPDPTLAVEKAVTLAIKNLDEKVQGHFRSYDDAIALARSELKDQLIAILATINDKFIANEKLVDQLGKANSTALTAALMTQEKSAAKSEQLIGDLIKQLKLSFDETNKATNEKIDRLTSRLDLGEGRIGGVTDNRYEARQDTRDTRQGAESTRNFILALIGTVLVATGIIVTALLRK
jgi:hypothetical protein